MSATYICYSPICNGQVADFCAKNLDTNIYNQRKGKQHKPDWNLKNRRKEKMVNDYNTLNYNYFSILKSDN